MVYCLPFTVYGCFNENEKFLISILGQLSGKEIDFVARRGDEVIYVQVALQVSGEETYEREFGNLKLIKDNYPKYVVTMDPNVGLIHDSGIVACSAREFLLNS